MAASGDEADNAESPLMTQKRHCQSTRGLLGSRKKAKGLPRHERHRQTRPDRRSPRLRGLRRSAREFGRRRDSGCGPLHSRALHVHRLCPDLLGHAGAEVLASPESATSRSVARASFERRLRRASGGRARGSVRAAPALWPTVGSTCHWAGEAWARCQ